MKDIINFNHMNDILAIAKHFFNSLSHITFIESIERLIDHKMVADEYNGCSFPADVDANEAPFEGIKFRFFDQEIIVQESVFRELIHKACLNFLKLYPEKHADIKRLFDKMK